MSEQNKKFIGNCFDCAEEVFEGDSHNCKTPPLEAQHGEDEYLSNIIHHEVYELTKQQCQMMARNIISAGFRRPSQSAIREQKEICIKGQPGVIRCGCTKCWYGQSASREDKTE